MGNNNNKTTYSHRFLARIVLEAETPLAIGSGEKDIRTDSLVAVDSNGLPYIPATSIAGVLRSMFTDIDTDTMFGFQKGESGHGSEIIFTEAKVMDSKSNVIDGINTSAIMKDSLLRHYQQLPVRQHVRIDGKGTAADSGLFNEQVVYAGTRFCFEIEMVSDGTGLDRFCDVLRKLDAVDFRLGGGTRSGFGKVSVVSYIKMMDLDLGKEEDLSLYLEKTSALNSDFWFLHLDKLTSLDCKDKQTDSKADQSLNRYTCYQLSLNPQDFFLFGSGFGDDQADMTPVKAKKVEWSKDGGGKMKGAIKDNMVLIPGSSLKGALEHRVAFYWNMYKGIYADGQTVADMENLVRKRNVAVKALFGSEGNDNALAATRGNVMVSDIIEDPAADKLLNHVSIDRFTGGAIDGALFSEKVSYGKERSYTTEIIIDNDGLKNACSIEIEWVNADAEKKADELKTVFQRALDDLCSGMLPLGGGVNRGHGVFTGEYTKTDRS